MANVPLVTNIVVGQAGSGHFCYGVRNFFAKTRFVEFRFVLRLVVEGGIVAFVTGIVESTNVNGQSISAGQ